MVQPSGRKLGKLGSTSAPGEQAVVLSVDLTCSALPRVGSKIIRRASEKGRFWVLVQVTWISKGSCHWKMTFLNFLRTQFRFCELCFLETSELREVDETGPAKYWNVTLMMWVTLLNTFYRSACSQISKGRDWGWLIFISQNAHCLCVLFLPSSTNRLLF